MAQHEIYQPENKAATIKKVYIPYSIPNKANIVDQVIKSENYYKTANKYLKYKSIAYKYLNQLEIKIKKLRESSNNNDIDALLKDIDIISKKILDNEYKAESVKKNIGNVNFSDINSKVDIIDKKYKTRFNKVLSQDNLEYINDSKYLNSFDYKNATEDERKLAEDIVNKRDKEMYRQWGNLINDSDVNLTYGEYKKSKDKIKPEWIKGTEVDKRNLNAVEGAELNPMGYKIRQTEKFKNESNQRFKQRNTYDEYRKYARSLGYSLKGADIIARKQIGEQVSPEEETYFKNETEKMKRQLERNLLHPKKTHPVRNSAASRGGGYGEAQTIDNAYIYGLNRRQAKREALKNLLYSEQTDNKNEKDRNK